MNVAIVHDQLNEFGGAERVLLALCQMYPDAPIYTAYCVKGSPAWKRFKDKDIRVSFMQHVWKLASPLRFLAPAIWNSFDFTGYDLIISSSSWYVTKGFKKKGPSTGSGSRAIEICYCHTPPRWLYGYPTAINWQKYWLIRVYATIVGFFMRQYDFEAAQRVDYFIANSKETQRRIAKFYRRDSTVIYPPITIPTKQLRTQNSSLKTYYLFVSRNVGSKGLELAIGAAKKLGFQLKIVGREGNSEGTIEYLGIVTDEELANLYAGAKAFLALATDEDFGMTPVEAMSHGTPVIAYNGGGYRESVVDGKTGILFNDATVESLVQSIEKFERRSINWQSQCMSQSKRFSFESFSRNMQQIVLTTIKS